MIPALAAILVLALLASPHSARAEPAMEGTTRVVIEAMEYPWSALGRLNVAGRGHCTAFLVGERQVMTAAHCLYDFRSGRWYAPGELHFLAAYQRERYLLHSKVANYARSSRFDPRADPNAAAVVEDWALLTLKKPLGRNAGWLPLKAMNAALYQRLRNGEGITLQAGYRGDRSHVLTATLSCPIAGFFADGLGIAHHCDVMRGDSGSPFLVYIDGTFYATGVHTLESRSRHRRDAGVLSLARFHPETGQSEAVKALAEAGVTWEDAGIPGTESPADAAPVKTIDFLLQRFGYMKATMEQGLSAERVAGIRRFQETIGLPPTGTPSPRLLGRLIMELVP